MDVTTDVIPTENSVGVGRRAGWIEEIVLTNFMCHSYVKVDFIQNVNFITGQNGSYFHQHNFAHVNRTLSSYKQCSLWFFRWQKCNIDCIVRCFWNKSQEHAESE